MKRRCVVWCFFSWALPKQWEVLVWEIHLPQAQTPRRFPGKPLCALAARWRVPEGQIGAALAGGETRGGLFSQRRFLAARAAPAHTSLIFGSTKMLQLRPAAPGGRGKAELIPRSLCRHEGMELALFSNRLPSTALSYSPISKRAQKPRRQLHQGMLSPEERYWSPLFPSTIRRSLHKDSLFLLLWLGPIWPERSPYSKQWTSSSADKTNH